MKKTLSLLTIAALSLGTALSAATLTIKVVGAPHTSNYPVSYGAELYDTYTQGTVSFNENKGSDIEAPFDLNEGLVIRNYQLVDIPDPSVLDLEITELVLDFTEINQYMPIPDWGSYLNAGASYSDILTDVDYLSFSFKLDYTNSKSAKFSLVDWYAELNSPIKITGLFKNGVEADGFLVTYTCDEAETPGATAQGGIVFFSEDVIGDVRKSEIVPEPTTATLSLLALAGLVARRRRK